MPTLSVIKSLIVSAIGSYILKAIPLPLALFFLAVNGFGNQLVYQACVGSLFAWMLCVSEKWGARFMWALSLSFFLLFPAIGQSTALIALLLICDGKREGAASLIGSQLLILMSPNLPIGSFWINTLCSGVIYILIYVLLLLRRERKIINALIILYGACLLWQSNQSWPLDSVSTAGIGSTIGKITHQIPQGNGQLIYSNSEYTPVFPTGTLYLDHDAKTDYDEGNFFQPRPWSHNALIAGEPLRVAAALDGALISNIGAKCTDAFGHILYAMTDGVSVVPLALNINNKLVLADSDYASNVLAPYQRNLLRRITGTDVGWRIYWCVLSLVLMGCIFIRGIWWLPMLNMGIFVGLMLIPIEGDIRYIGQPCLWPHTTQAGGIARALQESGHNVVFGNKNTNILVIAEGYHASARETEKLIILEPDASVLIQGIKYTAGNIPQGDVEGVRDARTIDREGKIIAYGKASVGEVEIIATGSPALTNEKEEEEE